MIRLVEITGGETIEVEGENVVWTGEFAPEDDSPAEHCPGALASVPLTYVHDDPQEAMYLLTCVPAPRR